MHTTSRSLVAWSGAVVAIVAAPGKAADPFIAPVVVSSDDTGSAVESVMKFNDAVAVEAARDLGPSATIGWDGVPAKYCTPNDFPQDYYNRLGDRDARGGEFETIGDASFRVSASPVSDPGSGPPVPPLFADIDATASSTLVPFSGSQIFALLGSNQTYVNFFVPGTKRPAVTRAFGLVFTGVDVLGSTTVELFQGGTSLGAYAVPVAPYPSRTSFIGFVYDNPTITRVLVRTHGWIGVKEEFDPTKPRGLLDVVAMDDLMFTAPVPAADLRTFITADRIDGDIRYISTIVNQDDVESSQVVVRQSIPKSVQLVSISPPGRIVDDSIVWELDSVGSQEARDLIVRVKAVSEGLHRSVVSAKSYSDPVPENDKATLPAAPSAFPATATYSSVENRLLELAGIARSLGLRRSAAAQLASPFLLAHRLVLKAAARQGLGRDTAAWKRLRAAASTLRRVNAVLRSRATRRLPPDSRDVIQTRTALLREHIVALRAQ